MPVDDEVLIAHHTESKSFMAVQTDVALLY
jgi:hypothetical protein